MGLPAEPLAEAHLSNIEKLERRALQCPALPVGGWEQVSDDVRSYHVRLEADPSEPCTWELDSKKFASMGCAL